LAVSVFSDTVLAEADVFNPKRAAAEREATALEQKHQAAKQMLAEARADVVQADHKASMVLAALGIGFAAVLGGQLAGRFDSSSLTDVGQGVWWVGVGIAVLAVGAAALAVWPRFSTKDHPQFGITYWGHAARHKCLPDLVDAFAKSDTTSPQRTLHQFWRVSRLLRWKYWLVRLALVLASAAGLLLGAATIVIR